MRFDALKDILFVLVGLAVLFGFLFWVYTGLLTFRGTIEEINKQRVPLSHMQEGL